MLSLFFFKAGVASIANGNVHVLFACLLVLPTHLRIVTLLGKSSGLCCCVKHACFILTGFGELTIFFKERVSPLTVFSLVVCFFNCLYFNRSPPPKF